MSSHREAPTISQDPAADSTDVYAFVSPDNAETVTILANYVPLQDPAGGPNFFEFGAASGSNTPAGGEGPVQYDINIDTAGTGTPTITYRFLFTTTITDPGTFLYATGPITPSNNGPGGTFNGYSSSFNRVQTYDVYRIDNRAGGVPVKLNASPLYCPPCNVGPRTTPNYTSLSSPAVYKMTGTGEIIFAGQRAEAFFVDLGSVFDLGDLRPLSGAHLIPGAASNGINPLADKNVHSIALQIPITFISPSGQLPAANSPDAVMGVWTTASRQTVRMINPDGTHTYSGPYQQISRLANPLVNEVVVPMNLKDFFNTQAPANDGQFAGAITSPELQKLLPVLYPGAFNNLKAYSKPRADLVAIFGTGIPNGVVPGFPGNHLSNNGTVAEMLRLNYSIAPTNGTSTFSTLGLLGGDPSGFPNGRRPTDDVVTIELQAVAGATIPLVDPSYTPDAVVKNPGLNEQVPQNAASLQASFPYLADPFPGFSNPTGTPGSNHNGSTSYTPTATGAQS